jgi:4-amino-4-deoxy-L-arabinose transferase-like glycosyltransferase
VSLWWRIWSVILILKFILAAWLPLSPDEAYYWVWGQHLQWSYYDHPPLVALLMRLGEWLPEMGRSVRWPAVLLAQGSLWFWRDLFRDWLTETQQVWWLLLICLMPLPGPGSLVVTPDLPLMFSWAWMLWSFHKLLASRGRWTWGLMFGVSVGFGVLSKYTCVLVAPILLVWWWRNRDRMPLRSWFPTALAAGLVISAPVWGWNWANDWASFRFQLQHGLGRKFWKPSWTYEYALAQIGLLFPTLIYLASRAKAPLEWRVAAWFPLGFFFLTSFKGYVEANWPLMAHPMVLALSISRAGIKVRRWHAPVAGLWAIGLILIVLVIGAPAWPEWLAKTRLRDLRQFDALTQTAAPLTPLFTRSYQSAAKLSYELKRPIAKLRGMNRFDFYDTLPESVPQGDRFFLIVEASDHIPEPWSQWQTTQTFQVDEKFRILELIKP